jgi:glutamate-1-semialdehyde 2,1-aminomutase
MTALDEAAFARLNAMAGRIMTELNQWSASRRSPFVVYGQGFSHLAYGYLTAPGLPMRNHRDYWHHLDADRTQIISLELARRGFFPVHRGEFSLSTARTDYDVAATISFGTGDRSLSSGVI